MKALIWGTGAYYERNRAAIQYQILLKKFEVVAITSNDTWFTDVDGMKFVHKKDLHNIDADICIVAMEDITPEVVDEILNVTNICEANIFHVRICNLLNLDIERLIKLSQSHISIMANCCWGSMTYNRLGLAMNTPFVSTRITDVEFIDFLQNPKENLKSEIRYKESVESSCHEFKVPVYTLDEMDIKFSHVNCTELDYIEAKWKERVDRVNWDNLFIMIFANNKRAIEQFEALPYERKVCFTNVSEGKGMKDVIYYNMDEQDAFRKSLRDVGAYDPIDLLCSGVASANR